MPSVTVYLGKGDIELLLQAREIWSFKHGAKPSIERMTKNCFSIGAKYLIEEAKAKQAKRDKR